MPEEIASEPASRTGAERRVAEASLAGTLVDFEPQGTEEAEALINEFRRLQRLWTARTEKMHKVVYAYGYDPTFDLYWRNGFDDAPGATRAEISSTMLEIATGRYDTPEKPDEFIADEFRDTEPSMEEIEAYNRGVR